MTTKNENIAQPHPIQRGRNGSENGESVSLRVVGTSMEPFLISKKDVVRITPFSSYKLHCGDVVLFKVNDFYCLHRIVQIKGTLIILCGDGLYQSKEMIRVSNDLIFYIFIGLMQNGHWLCWRTTTYR